MKRLLLSFLFLHGCAVNCTEMGCVGALNVYLQGAPADGDWSIELQKDGASQVCHVVLPDGEPVCSSPLSLSVEDLGMTVSWATMMGETGETAHLRVSRDGVLLIDEDIEMKWSDPVYPNGKACDDGMGCSTAEAKFPLE